MKILELRFKNLNSLYGEWLIDFTDPNYLSSGIFALTGPTGAGKSTILDAICLALYGATPRLGKITKSSNELMSRQTTECYAEVLLESQAGQFRCQWQQRRARKRVDGKLQDQEHHISHADTGKLIESKKSLVAKVIEEKTGMDFDRFTRSMLLAQGGFDTFLKAGDEEKSKILEQITGTSIYSDISQRTHERQRDERDKLNVLRAATADIVLLERDQELSIQQSLKDKQATALEITKETESIDKSIAWLNTINDLQQEINSLEDESMGLHHDRDAFQPQQRQLDLAIKASTLDAKYAKLTALRQQQKVDIDTLRNQKLNLPTLSHEAQQHSEQLAQANKSTAEAKLNLQSALPLLQRVRTLDNKIAEQLKTINEGQQTIQRITTQIDQQQTLKQQHSDQRLILQNQLAESTRYLEDNKADEWLLSGLTGIEQQIQNLQAKQKDIDEAAKNIEIAQQTMTNNIERLNVIDQQCLTSQNALEHAINEEQKAQTKLSDLLNGRQLREYRNDKETLLRELSNIQQINELAEQRKRLEDGNACPLCGSLEHPYATGNKPQPNSVEQRIDSLNRLINDAEKQESTIKALEKIVNTARLELNNSEQAKIHAIAELHAAEKAVDSGKAQQSMLVQQFDEQKHALIEKLQPLGITEIDQTSVVSLLEILQRRRQRWQDKKTAQLTIEQQISDIDSELTKIQAIIQTHEKSLAEQREQFATLQQQCDSTRTERFDLYADKLTDEEEKRLYADITTAESKVKNVRELHEQYQQQLTKLESQLATIQQQLSQRQPDLDKHETSFAATLDETGFGKEGDFIAAQLSSTEKQRLLDAASALEHRSTALLAKQKDRQARLANERAKQVTQHPLDELQTLSQENKQKLHDIREDISGLQQQLRDNDVARERIKGQQSAIDAQQLECQRWNKLHELIGSADGKKYRNFAQGLTFQLMISHANAQLEKMTDRYLLVRDDKYPLQLNVIDQYQAGEIRSTKNLSGGESFIVSLTLALGLSKMASRNVRVDSLFLDEGFGTLDEEALETALETLTSLHQDGKLIGVISHVTALKERISTQIQVIPMADGRSSITGPGCQRLQKH